jgi:hypothetical protein
MIPIENRIRNVIIKKLYLTDRISYWKNDNDENTDEWCHLCSDPEAIAGTYCLRNNLMEQGRDSIN